MKHIITQNLSHYCTGTATLPHVEPPPLTFDLAIITVALPILTLGDALTPGLTRTGEKLLEPCGERPGIAIHLIKTSQGFGEREKRGRGLRSGPRQILTQAHLEQN